MRGIHKSQVNTGEAASLGPKRQTSCHQGQGERGEDIGRLTGARPHAHVCSCRRHACCLLAPQYQGCRGGGQQPQGPTLRLTRGSVPPPGADGGHSQDFRRLNVHGNSLGVAGSESAGGLGGGGEGALRVYISNRPLVCGPHPEWPGYTITHFK